MKRLVIATGAVLLLSAGPAAAAVAPGQQVEVGAMQSDSVSVSLIAAVDPLPVPALSSSAVSATSDGMPLTTRMSAIMPPHGTAAFVVDGSADGATALGGQGRSGAAGFLLQLPPAATNVVIADREPASVVAGPVSGVAAGVNAVTGLKNTGERDTVAALDLAISRLPAWPSAQPVVVLYTGAVDAGGPTSAELTARLLKAHAVLGVVTTASSGDYWSRVARGTGASPSGRRRARRSRPSTGCPTGSRRATRSP